MVEGRLCDCHFGHCCLFPGFLFFAGYIGALGAILGIGGATLGYFGLLKGLGEINNDQQLNSLVAFTALKGLASILLSSVTLAFYNSMITFGTVSQVLPFSLMNFCIFFISGWFF